MNTTESNQPGFGVYPEALNSINVSFTTIKFILTMVNSIMLFVAKINKAIITAPTVSEVVK